MAGNHTGSSLSPMSYWPACPLPFLKACTWVRHFFLSKFTSSICIQWMCVGLFYGCDRVPFYDGINNMKSIFSIYSVPFIRFTNALLRQWNMYLVLKPPTHEPLAFFYPFMSFLYQTVCDILLLYICLPTGFFYALLSNRYFFFIGVLWNSLKACMW